MANYDLIVLGVFSTNVNAIGLYKKLGFLVYGRLPNGYKRGRTHADDGTLLWDNAIADRIHMYLPLRAHG